METTDQTPATLARLRERTVESMDQWRRGLRLDGAAGFDPVRRHLDRLERECDILQACRACLEADFGTLNADVATLRTDVALLRADVARLRGAAQELKGTVRWLGAQAGRDHPGRSGQLLRACRRLDDLARRVRELEASLPPG